VVWDALRIISTEKRTKTAKMRACELQSMPIFYISPMHVLVPGLTVGGALVLQLLYVNYQIDQSLREAGSYPNGPARFLLLYAVAAASLETKWLSSVCRPIKSQVSITQTYEIGHFGVEGTGLAPITKIKTITIAIN
jgi:hypothetical protein